MKCCKEFHLSCRHMSHKQIYWTSKSHCDTENATFWMLSFWLYSLPGLLPYSLFFKMPQKWETLRFIYGKLSGHNLQLMILLPKTLYTMHRSVCSMSCCNVLLKWDPVILVALVAHPQDCILCWIYGLQINKLINEHHVMALSCYCKSSLSHLVETKLHH